MKLSTRAARSCGVFMTVAAVVVFGPASVQIAGARSHAAGAHKGPRASASSETGCRYPKFFPACISLIMESNGTYCLASSGPRGEVTSQKCNPNDWNQLWMAIPNALGPAYYQLLNVGSSCPSSGSYWACGTPSGVSNVKDDTTKFGYGFCMKSPWRTPTTAFEVTMGPCFSLLDTHGLSAFQRQASDFLPGPAGSASYLMYEGAAAQGNAWVVSTSGGAQAPGFSIRIVRASKQNAENELFYGAVLDASGAADGDPPPAVSG